MKYIFKNWKTSLLAIMIGTISIFLGFGKINMQEWCAGVGAVGTLWLLISKDPDKTTT